MKNLFLFFVIVLMITSCTSTPKIPESNLVDEVNEEETTRSVETVQSPIPEKEQEIEIELAVLPDEVEEVVEETIIEEAEPVELAEETPLEPVIEKLEITEPALAKIPEAIDKYIEPEVMSEAVAEAIPDVIQDVIPEVVVPETVAEVIPPVVVTPAPVVEAPPPADPTPEPIPPPVAQVQPPEEEPPAVVPVLPSVPPGPLPALSGQYEEMELLPGTFSRIVQAVVGQLIEIPFSGNGWLYLGEAESRRGVAYESRRVDPEGQSFIFRADAAGVYALKFYRQDFVRNFILNDQVQVIVGEAIGGVTSNRSRVIAEPRWPSPTEEAQALRSNSRPAVSDGATRPVTPAVDSGAQTATPTQPVAPVTPVQPSQPERTSSIPTAQPNEGIASARPPAPTSEATVTPSVPTVPSPLAADEYLKQAKEEFDATRVAAAISLLDQFSEHYPPERTILSDELYWLYGQFYEANSSSRNILLSLDYYRRLINEYPQSNRCNDARRRISYLERYFINNR